jgi:hypothetical protein
LTTKREKKGDIICERERQREKSDSNERERERHNKFIGLGFFKFYTQAGWGKAGFIPTPHGLEEIQSVSTKKKKKTTTKSGQIRVGVCPYLEGVSS